MELMDHLKVAPTASLVLVHAHSLFNAGLTKDYFSQLDLTEARALAEKMHPAAGDAILMRKRFVRYLLDQYLYDEEPVQVCILGAGLDPLSLHLLEHHPHAVESIFEVDADHLQVKAKHYHNLLPQQPVHFIQADVTDTLHLTERLRDAGYCCWKPAIIVFEGIMPYLSDEQFLNIMQAFRTQNKTNVVLMDYMLPPEELPMRIVPVFNDLRIQMEAFIGGSFQLYSRSRVFSLVDLLQGDVAGVDSMQDAEFKLNGRNERYYEDGEGFIEMISFYL